MNKNLLRVIVFVGYILVVFGLMQLVNQIIPSQSYKTFTVMGMIRFGVIFLVMISSIYGVQLILRKYGAQITPITSPRAKAILWLVLIFSFFMLLFGPYLFFNGRLPWELTFLR